MRFDKLDLNLLAALDALIDTCSVSDAARRLHLSQPALTGALNRLREFFQDDLLVQQGRGMILTRRAEELADPVRRALMLIRAEITRPEQFNPAVTERRFTIVSSDYAFTIILAAIFRKAAEQAPGISFELVPPSSQADEALRRAEIDLFFTVEPFVHADHPSERLWQDEEVIISWADAGYPPVISEETFFAAGHAVALFGPDRRPTRTDLHLRQTCPGRRVLASVPSFSELPLAIVGTKRLATMHRLYAEHFAQFYPITLHQPWTPFPEIIEVVQWHSVRKRDAGVQWLLNQVRQHLDRLPQECRMLNLTD